jgi:hypothetical protein
VNAISLPLRAARAGTPLSTWQRWVREPLLHFALIGAAIFGVAHFIEQAKQEAQTHVIVDSGLRGRLASLYRTQYGVSPTDRQMRIIVDDYLDDEVLYREGLRLGLAEDDEIIRRRIIQKLDFLQHDSISSGNPAPAQLRAWYDAHPQQFSVGPRVSFTHVYFNPDRGGEAAALIRAREAREAFLRGDAPVGDAFPLENEYSELTRDQVTRLFGASNFIDGVFARAPGDWSEPVRSGFGWHIVKVTATEPGKVLPFEQVLPDVRSAYLHEATIIARRQQLDALRAQYHLEPRAATP